MRRRTPAADASPELTHVDGSGRVRMVDVGAKPITAREAVAHGTIAVSAAVQRLVRSGRVRKGDPLETARLAGIMAAKRTSEIIPLCHPIALSHVDVDIAPTRTGYRITATARTTAQTGVEMEALTAVSAAALTIYDMLKAADREMVIGEICVVEKKGGRSGHYKRSR
jgi:cyclic pyranopterin monophosphate synthase